VSSTGAGGQVRAGVDEGTGRARVFVRGSVGRRRAFRADRQAAGDIFVRRLMPRVGVERFVTWGGDRQTLPDGGRIPTGRTVAPC
jgi:hypothetical protein